MRSGPSILMLGAALLLCGCDREPTPFQRAPLRPGADRQAGISAQLPAASHAAGYDNSAVPVDVDRETKIGSVVPAGGGQQAQREKEQKAIAGIREQWERERAGEATTAGLPPATEKQANQ